MPLLNSRTFPPLLVLDPKRGYVRRYLRKRSLHTEGVRYYFERVTASIGGNAELPAMGTDPALAVIEGFRKMGTIT